MRDKIQDGSILRGNRNLDAVTVRNRGRDWAIAADICGAGPCVIADQDIRITKCVDEANIFCRCPDAFTIVVIWRTRRIHPRSGAITHSLARGRNRRRIDKEQASDLNQTDDE